MAKVLLINPNTRYLGSMMTILPPLGLLYIASMLKREGHEVKVVDADVENLSLARSQKRPGIMHPIS
jgi:B12 binding domain.